MRGHFRSSLVALFLSASPLGVQGQEPPKAEPKPATVALFEDDAAALIPLLNNHGATDASLVSTSDNVRYTGARSLAVTPFQRFNSRLPGWQYRIVENPELGEYRYIRWAWKRTAGPGIMLQLHAAPRTWHRYYAGSVSATTKGWGAMIQVAEEPPREWQLVTRDLVKDFGPMVVTGISFTAMEGGGRAYYDHIYLGRTVADLDAITVPEPDAPPEADHAPPESERGWLCLLSGVAAAVGAALVLVVAFLWWRRQSSDA